MDTRPHVHITAVDVSTWFAGHDVTRRRDPTPIAATVHGLAAAYAHRSPNPATRLRQLHEINPGAYHHTHGLTPATCPHCQDEETP